MAGIKYPIVDDHDKIIGEMSKDEAYKQGMMLRSIQIFLFDEEGRIFIQKRGNKKKRLPSYLCASVSGHVEPGESYREAAKRELKEELGVKGELRLLATEKTPIGSNQFAMMAHFVTKTSDEILIQTAEIEDGRYYSINEICNLIEGGSSFTPSFLHYFGKVKKTKF